MLHDIINRYYNYFKEPTIFSGKTLVSYVESELKFGNNHFYPNITLDTNIMLIFKLITLSSFNAKILLMIILFYVNIISLNTNTFSELREFCIITIKT